MTRLTCLAAIAFILGAAALLSMALFPPGDIARQFAVCGVWFFAGRLVSDIWRETWL